MQVAAHSFAVFCVLVAQAYILFYQIDAGTLKNMRGMFDIVKWQIAGQVFATLVAPHGFRCIATALSSFVAAVLGFVLACAWLTVVFPIMTLIAWNNGHPQLFVGFVGLTAYVAASLFAVLAVKEIDEMS